MPVVFINGYVEGIEAPFFSSDDRRRDELAVGHLVQLGHERIGLAIGPRRYVPGAPQARGLRRAPWSTPSGSSPERRARAGSPRGCSRVEGGAAAARGCSTGRDRDRLRLGPDGARRDPRRPRARPATCPGTSRWSGSTTRALIQFLDPPLTTVRQPVQALAAAAVSALADAIDGIPVPPQEYLYKPELVLRASTGRAPAEAQPMRVPSSAPTA